MTIFDMPNYLWITILGMILLTVFYTLVLNKWFQSAISFLIWYFSRNWRKNRRKIKLEKEIRKYDDEESLRRHHK